MKKIIVSNREFDFDKGLRLLKLKYDICPFPEIENVWDTIQPYDFKDIAIFTNIEDRRVGFLCLGIDKLQKQAEPILINTKTIKKKTTFIGDDGSSITHEYDDVFELYQVDREKLKTNDHVYFVKCKDTSTNREYLIWVDMYSIVEINYDRKRYNFSKLVKKVTALDAIAWTIQTDVPEGHIKEIVRHGDCVLIKTKGEFEPLSNLRHITTKEYKKYLKLES